MVAALMLGLTAAGTAAPATPDTASLSPGQSFKRTELFFGTGKPDGSEVTPTEFELFLDKEATPAFPDGLTVLPGKGQFKGANGEIVKEHSFVLILLYPPTDRDANREVEEIRGEYKKQFQQESVLRADSTERVSF